MNRGTFIVFEGLDGCGKSTQLRLLAERLRAEGRDVVETAEPWQGGEWGPRIREMARSGDVLAPAEELRWFREQRREHVREVVEPALAAGRIVLSDRYYLSTAAYQGARGLDPEAILRRNEQEFPIPDLVILLVADVDTCLARLAERPGPSEPVFERRDFQLRVAERFATLDRPYITRLDATPPEQEVAAAVGMTSGTVLLP